MCIDIGSLHCFLKWLEEQFIFGGWGRANKIQGKKSKAEILCCSVSLASYSESLCGLVMGKSICLYHGEWKPDYFIWIIYHPLALKMENLPTIEVFKRLWSLSIPSWLPSLPPQAKQACLALGPLHWLFLLPGALPGLFPDPLPPPSGPWGPTLTSHLKWEPPCYSQSLPISGPFGTYHSE